MLFSFMDYSMPKIVEFIKKFTSHTTSEVEFQASTTKMISLIFLSIAFVITLFTHSSTSNFLFFIPRAPTNIRPDFISSCFSLLLVVPLYARGILKWSISIYGILNFILFLSIFASLTQIALGGSQHDITKYLLAAAVLISWAGIKAFASAAWILAVAAAILNIVNANINLGVWGFIFVCSFVLGLTLHARLSPSNILSGLIAEYRSGSGN